MWPITTTNNAIHAHLKDSRLLKTFLLRSDSTHGVLSFCLTAPCISTLISLLTLPYLKPYIISCQRHIGSHIDTSLPYCCASCQVISITFRFWRIMSSQFFLGLPAVHSAIYSCHCRACVDSLSSFILKTRQTDSVLQSILQCLWPNSKTSTMRYMEHNTCHAVQYIRLQTADN